MDNRHPALSMKSLNMTTVSIPSASWTALISERDALRKQLDEIETAWAKASARAKEINAENERLLRAYEVTHAAMVATGRERDALQDERDALRGELAQERNERDATADMLREARAEVESLQDAHAIMKNVADGRKAEIERLRAVVAEVRKLEAVDHGVAWPDLCHALYELDRSNCC